MIETLEESVDFRFEIGCLVVVALSGSLKSVFFFLDGVTIMGSGCGERF